VGVYSRPTGLLHPLATFTLCFGRAEAEFVVCLSALLKQIGNHFFFDLFFDLAPSFLHTAHFLFYTLPVTMEFSLCSAFGYLIPPLPAKLSTEFKSSIFSSFLFSYFRFSCPLTVISFPKPPQSPPPPTDPIPPTLWLGTQPPF